jgi:hypothetical protein
MDEMRSEATNADFSMTGGSKQMPDDFIAAGSGTAPVVGRY